MYGVRIPINGVGIVNQVELALIIPGNGVVEQDGRCVSKKTNYNGAGKLVNDREFTYI
jgi:hypothetical protein